MIQKIIISLLTLNVTLSAFAYQKSDGVKPENFVIENKNINEPYLSGLKKLRQKELPVTANNWMVVTANPQASKAAAKILDQGGTAVDAMVAAQIVLGLVEPESSGLGGGAFLLYYDNNKKTLTSLDGRETAPSKVTASMFLDDKGNPISFMDAVVGGRSVGVPGTPALLEDAYTRWGKISWPLLFEEGIRLADYGFIVSQKLSSSVKKQLSSIKKVARTKDYFIPNNLPIKSGQMLSNAAYAETIRKFSKYGAEIFYSGEIADDIIATVQGHNQNPGVLSKNDLSSYKVKEREPVCAFYRDHKVCGMGPPSSGALTISQILGMIENFDLSELGRNNPESWRIIGDASRLAFADRSLYMADSDFVSVPIEGLLDKKYIKNRAKQLERKMSIPVINPGRPNTKSSLTYSQDISIEFPSTSHISIVDTYGNALSMTTTIESAFGSRLMTKSGFLLNNELTDFSFVSHSDGKVVANRIEPGKRPRSSMSPTIIFQKNKPIYIIGSPGGSNIIGYVLSAIIALIDWDMNVRQAVSAPHAINKFGTYNLEKNTTMINIKKPLEKMGYKVELSKFFSGLNIIKIKGSISGASDPRREGVAIGG